MATATAFLPLDMFAEPLWFGDIIGIEPNSFTVSNGNRTATYYGDFVYLPTGNPVHSDTGWPSGTVNGIQEWRSGSAYYTISDAHVEFSDLYNSGSYYQASSHLFAGDDTFFGSNGDENVWTFSGNDSVLAGSGADSIDGGAGDDTIKGEDGNDTLFGREGSDVLIGGSGADELYGWYYPSYADPGGADGDFADGGEGEDLVHGSKGNDTLLGGADNDTLVGGDGDDLMYGDSGDDVLFGDGVTDFFYLNDAGGRMDDGGTGVGWNPDVINAELFAIIGFADAIDVDVIV